MTDAVPSVPPERLALAHPAPQLGLRLSTRWVRNRDGIFEHREQVRCLVECPFCGEEFALTAETDGWTEKVRGSKVWRHTSYGPATGGCCGQDFADWWEGTFAIGPRKSA